ncbi:MAG TPA: family 14 glycosylhydrolase, partial [Anaerolineae bacterium]
MQQEIVVCGVPFETEHEQDALRQLKDLGVTSVQIYTFWKDFEPSGRGQFDWRFYDREVELIQKAGLKYVPFILMGPKYAVPQWWLDDPKHAGLYCLEHHKYNPIESIWNPAFRVEISRVLQSFAAHYLPMNVLESIQPGICGDYGEAIMPVHGNWPGDYHTHRGYWCAGEDAQASFIKWLTRKYQSAKALNAAWRSHYRALREVTPFMPHQTPSRTALFDMLDWYNDSMTEYSEFWLRECRAAFPQTSVYLCTGGSEEPEHASSFSSQARVAGKHGCGIRLTNEGNKFYDNFFITAYTESACNLYGAYMGLEPVGPITDKGVVARIFGSADYGNRQMFHYFTNLFEEGVKPRPSTEGFKKYIPMIQERPMPETVGFFWPGYYAALNGGMPENVD